MYQSFYTLGLATIAQAMIRQHTDQAQKWNIGKMSIHPFLE